jgi:hypothetical protein
MLSVILAAAITTASPSASATATTPGRAADPLVCHVEPIEGSRITRKICMRVSEVERRRLEARWLLDRVQSGSQAPNMATMVQMGPMR